MLLLKYFRLTIQTSLRPISDSIPFRTHFHRNYSFTSSFHNFTIVFPDSSSEAFIYSVKNIRSKLSISNSSLSLFVILITTDLKVVQITVHEYCETIKIQSVKYIIISYRNNKMHYIALISLPLIPSRALQNLIQRNCVLNTSSQLQPHNSQILPISGSDNFQSLTFDCYMLNLIL